MEKMLKNKYDWRGIFLWSLVPIFLTGIFHGINLYFNFKSYNLKSHHDDYVVLFLIPYIVVLLWGILSGLCYDERNNYLNKYIIFRNYFSVFFIFVTSYFLIMVIWFSTKGTRELSFDANKVYDAIVGSFYLSFLFFISFFIGHIFSLIINFVINKLFRKF